MWRALERRHQVTHLVDSDDDVESTPLAVAGVEDPDQLIFAGGA